MSSPSQDPRNESGPKPQSDAAPRPGPRISVKREPAAPTQPARAPRAAQRQGALVQSPAARTATRPPSLVLSTERPLIEAIVELRWALGPAADGRPVLDPGYDMLLGRMSDRLRGAFPRLAPLPAAGIPHASTPFRPRHQLRAAKSDWPLVQLGPGMLTVNESSAYRWAAFEASATRTLGELFAAYPRELHSFAPASLALRYVNALPTDREELPLVAFLRDRLHTSLSIDPALFEDPDESEEPASLQFSMSYPLTSIAGAGSIAFASASVTGKRCILWTLEAAVGGAQVPATPAAIGAWLEGAHATLSRWFATLSRGTLASQFSGLAR